MSKKNTSDFSVFVNPSFQEEHTPTFVDVADLAYVPTISAYITRFLTYQIGTLRADTSKSLIAAVEK